jgi:hypothetical protein
VTWRITISRHFAVGGASSWCDHSSAKGNALATPGEYKRQIEAGKQIVKEVFCRLATSFDAPRIAEFKFIQTHPDFDDHEGRLSLFDPTTEKIVAKLRVRDLADAPAKPTRRKQLEDHVQAAVIQFAKTNRK